MLHVGAGQEFKSIGAAVAAAADGDTVVVGGGVYRERVVVDKAIAVVAAEGEAPIIDGGWDGKQKTQSWQSQITLAAPGATVRGLTIRNCPGRAIYVNASDATLEGCLAENTYQGAILVGDSSGAAISSVVVRGNTFREMSGAWDAGDRGKNGRTVNGSFNIQNCRDSWVEYNDLYNGNGEGINIGRGSVGVVVRGNTVHSTNHVLVYVNRAEGTQIIENLLYHIPEPRYGGPKGDTYSAAIVLGDEGGPISASFPASHGTSIRGNIVVNAGKMIQVRNNKDNYNTQLLDTTIKGNTFIAGPNTEQGIMIQANVHGRPHEGSVFSGNVIDFTHAAPGADIGTHPQGSGVTFDSNAWSRQPPAALRSVTDITGELGIVRPDAPRVNIELDNYRPRADSPLVAGGRQIGALSAVVPEPPIEPPIDPEPDYEPVIVLLEGNLARLEEAGLAVGAVVVETHELIDRLRMAAGYVEKESK